MMEQEYIKLKKQIDEWNNHRLQLFEISPPNHALEYFGVMRFYLYDAEEEVQTKCLRISSSATTVDVVEALLTKFWCDLKNLDSPNNAERYSLYEVHQNEERRLGADEFPLAVQLNWTADCRDGRFLLKCIDQTKKNQNKKSGTTGSQKNRKKSIGGDKQNGQPVTSISSSDVTNSSVSAQSLSQKLYSEKPDSQFTRSISNLEGAMKKKRKDKVENKLKAFENGDGGPDSGGPLKVYGTKLMPQYHYKAVLVSKDDSTAHVVTEALSKFNIDTPDPHLYCLAQVTVPPGKKEGDYNFNVQASSGSLSGGWSERFMEDSERPWHNFSSFPVQRGSLMFLLCQRPPELMKHKTNPSRPLADSNRSRDDSGSHSSYGRDIPSAIRPDNSRNSEMHAPSSRNQTSPKEHAYLIELPSDNSRGRSSVLKHDLIAETSDIGSDPTTGVGGGQFLQLYGPGVRPHHCIVALSGTSSFTLSPSHDAEVHVNGHRIAETVILPPGAVIQIGKVYQFQFVVPQMLTQGHLPPAALRAQPNNIPPANLNNGHNRPDSGSGRNLHMDIPQSTRGQPRFNPGNSEVSPKSPIANDVPDFDFSTLVDTEETDNYSDDELPAAIEFVDDVETEIVDYCVTKLDEVMTMFKIAPSFTIYMCTRYRLSSKYDPSLARRVQRIQHFLSNVIREIDNIVNGGSVSGEKTACRIAVWMANVAELYHFLHQDKQLHSVTLQQQNMLLNLTRSSSKNFFKCVQAEIDRCFSAFFDPSDRDNDIDPRSDVEIDANKYTHYLNRWLTPEIQGSRGEKPEIAHVIEILSSAWVLLRKCRVNATLNLQIFASLLKFVGTVIFNTLLSTPHLCTAAWSVRLSRRLKRLDDWAVRYSLEVAAESTLSKVVLRPIIACVFNV